MKHDKINRNHIILGDSPRYVEELNNGKSFYPLKEECLIVLLDSSEEEVNDILDNYNKKELEQLGLANKLGKILLIGEIDTVSSASLVDIIAPVIRNWTDTTVTLYPRFTQVDDITAAVVHQFHDISLSFKDAAKVAKIKQGIVVKLYKPLLQDDYYDFSIKVPV